MKKIVSALALGALAFGSASARMSVNLQYRNGAYLFSYAQNGESTDEAFGTKEMKELNLFNLSGFNKGTDALEFKASGDVLSFRAQLAPHIEGWSKNTFKILTIGADLGAFGVKAGWNKDGEAEGSFRIAKDHNDSNWEGGLFERFKPGSMFKGSYANYSINQINIGSSGNNKGLQGKATDVKSDLDENIKNSLFKSGDSTTGIGNKDTELYLQAAFTLAIPNSDAALKLLGTVISDRAWGTSKKDADYITTDSDKQNEGHLAYTVFAIFSKPSVFSAMGFMKMSPHCFACDRDQVFVPGAYLELMAIKNLDVMGGFTMSIVEGIWEDYAFDLRARVAIGSALSLTYYGNITILNGDVADTAQLNGEVGTYGDVQTTVRNLSTNRAMWNHLNVRFALSDTIVPQLGISAITDLGDGINLGPQKGEGTELSITPAVQFFAARNASINVGFNVTFRGIGKEEHPVSSAYKPNFDATATQQGLDLALALPVLFRVKM